MSTEIMNPMQRVLTTLGFSEADRVPFFLLLSMYGAKFKNMTIKDYFNNPEAVAETQLQMRETYKHDCFYTFYYAPIEIEVLGGDVVFTSDGPPNSGTPVISKFSDIDNLEFPAVRESKTLNKVLKATELLVKEVKDTVPIVGVVMSPFSLPVMQMGFDKYLNLIYENETYFRKLMEANTKFCIEWSNAQLEAGATAICYFDPVSSSTIIPKDLYLKTGYQIAKQTISQIKGPTATHLASGISIPIADQLSTTGTAIIGVSSSEDITDLKKAFDHKLTIIGNLNGIQMRHWTEQETIDNVTDAIQKGAPGGGFILSDNHGEIPWQVSHETLMTFSRTVHEFGYYPIKD